MKLLDYFYFSMLQHVVYNDIFDSFGNILKTFAGRLQSVSFWVAVVCVVVVGVMFMFGEGAARGAKKWLLYIIAGCIVVWGAMEFVQTVQGVSNGGF